MLCVMFTIMLQTMLYNKSELKSRTIVHPYKCVDDAIVNVDVDAVDYAIQSS